MTKEKVIAVKQPKVGRAPSKSVSSLPEDLEPFPETNDDTFTMADLKVGSYIRSVKRTYSETDSIPCENRLNPTNQNVKPKSSLRRHSTASFGEKSAAKLAVSSNRFVLCQSNLFTVLVFLAISIAVNQVYFKYFYLPALLDVSPSIRSSIKKDNPSIIAKNYDHIVFPSLKDQKQKSTQQIDYLRTSKDSSLSTHSLHDTHLVEQLNKQIENLNQIEEEEKNQSKLTTIIISLELNDSIQSIFPIYNYSTSSELVSEP